MWRDMAVWVSYGGINIGGRIKQSFYPRTRHGELKVISMIYAPPYLIRRQKLKVKSIARSHVSDDNPESTRRQTLESKQRLHHYYYGAPQDQEGHTIQRTTTSHLPSRGVTNSLSGASVTHDEYRTL